MNRSEQRAISALFPDSIEIPELGPGPRSGTLTIATLDERIVALNYGGDPSPRLIRAIALAWHDHHDEAHEIVQEMPSPDAAYIHAILHRREPDYFNAKYWFRRVGDHPAFPQLAARAVAILREASDREKIARLLPDASWDANAFVDACEDFGPISDPIHTTLRRIQQAEFETLLIHLLQEEY